MPWLEKFPLNRREVNSEEDEHFKNNILDLINRINELLK